MMDKYYGGGNIMLPDEKIWGRSIEIGEAVRVNKSGQIGFVSEKKVGSHTLMYWLNCHEGIYMFGFEPDEITPLENP